ncbi:MAG TPA: complex I NDUFA9 subunit family protein [Rhizomicrobium sp.]
MSMLVTVFGGSGFLGRYVVRALARAGHRVRVGVRRPNVANYLLPMAHVGQIQLVTTDVRDSDAVARALNGAEAAVNLVGILYESGKQRFDAVHVQAAGTIARVARARGLRALVHVSALGARPDSSSLYARSKAAGEAAVRDGFAAAAILRPSILFGPEDNFFNRFAGLARLSPALPLIGGGRTRFQPAYVCDVAEAVVRCLEEPAGQGTAYELGGPRIYTFRQLLEIVLAETNRRRLLVPIPFSIAMIQAAALGLLPKPLLTRDQVRLLEQDNVVSPEAHNFADLGIDPESLETIVPTYLWRFRREGQFEAPPSLPLSASQ